MAGQINFLTYMQELYYFLAARRDFLETRIIIIARWLVFSAITDK